MSALICGFDLVELSGELKPCSDISACLDIRAVDSYGNRMLISFESNQAQVIEALTKISAVLDALQEQQQGGSRHDSGTLPQ